MNKFFCVLKDHKGNYWFGTQNGLFCYDINQEEFTHFKNNPNDVNSLLSNELRCFLQDSKGDIWIGKVNGMTIYNVDQKKFESIGFPNFKNIAPVRDFAEDDKKRIWY